MCKEQRPCLYLVHKPVLPLVYVVNDSDPERAEDGQTKNILFCPKAFPASNVACLQVRPDFQQFPDVVVR